MGELMRRFVEAADRGQWTLLPECLYDFIDESNPVRVIDVFVDALDLAEMSLEGVEPAGTGRPSYHPSVLLKLYIYGYLNRVQSSRRLEREAGRNLEVMWLLVSGLGQWMQFRAVRRREFMTLVGGAVCRMAAVGRSAAIRENSARRL